MLRLLRFALLIVLAFLTLGLIVAIGGSETGAFEKVVLGLGVVGLVALAAPVRRIGAHA